jgi:cell division protein FtsL
VLLLFLLCVWVCMFGVINEHVHVRVYVSMRDQVASRNQNNWYGGWDTLKRTPLRTTKMLA